MPAHSFLPTTGGSFLDLAESLGYLYLSLAFLNILSMINDYTIQNMNSNIGKADLLAWINQIA